MAPCVNIVRRLNIKREFLMNTQTWQIFAKPNYALRFRYPPASAQGEPVEIKETRSDQAIRVHLLTPDKEVYFEVTRYEQYSPEEAYNHLKQEIEQAGRTSQVSRLQETRLAGQPAFTFSLRRDEIERVALLVRHEQALYRLLYNPHEPVNRHILATVEFW